MDTSIKARQLRRFQTDTEKRLWQVLRNRQLAGHKFRRQYPIGPYIVDFVCWEQRLVVELDGGQHMEQQAYDERRSVYLNQQGFHVVRFWNNDVLNNLDGVVHALTLALSQRERGQKPKEQ
jgi:very-short-patch-repair endonuclease